MISTLTLNLQAAHTYVAAAQTHLLDHMGDQPDAYASAPGGLKAYKALMDAAALLSTLVYDEAVAAVSGDVVNG